MCTILVLIIRCTLIILATRTNETISTIQIVPPPTRTSPKAYIPHPCSGSSAPLLVASLPSIPTSSPTSTILITSNMTKVTTNTVHSTRYRSSVKKKNDAAADDLQKIVAAEKRDHEEKKKKQAYEKKVKEEMKKKSDEEKKRRTGKRLHVRRRHKKTKSNTTKFS